MPTEVDPQSTETAGSMIRGNSRMSAEVRALPWQNTSLGAIEGWPAELLTSVNSMLTSRQIACVIWGETDPILLYNDLYVPLLGNKNPTLGERFLTVWSEIREQAAGLIGEPFHTKEANIYEKVPFRILVHGEFVEKICTLTNNPIWSLGPDESRILGLYQTIEDHTEGETAVRELREERELLRKSEAEGREREEYLNLVLNSSAAGIYSIDTNGVTTSCNHAFLEMLGFGSVTDVVGKKLHQVIHHSHPDGSFYDEKDCPILRAAKTGKPAHVVSECFFAVDGTGIPVEYWAYPIYHDGQLRGAVTNFADIRDRLRAERELGESREQMNLAFEGARLAAWSYDPVAGVVHGDALMQTFFGLSNPSAPAAAWIAAICEEDRRRVAKEFADGVQGLPYDTEYRLQTDGVTRWVRAKAHLTHFADGHPRLVGICGDVTLDKQNEATLRQTEKLAAVGRLASSIAHEINNPLEAVTNLLYLARTSERLDQAHEYLDAAERELRRVSAISNQTLRFHRQATRPTEITADALFESVLSIYQGRLVNSHVQVKERLRANQPILCFEGEIRQVLSNFVGNAIDAMHPTGGKLLLRSRCATEWKTGRRGLTMTISDTGSGMSEATVAKLYTPFFTTKGIGGTGLGLWVSQEIVERHHGLISVRSSQSPDRHGTVFTVFLPFNALDEHKDLE